MLKAARGGEWHCKVNTFVSSDDEFIHKRLINKEAEPLESE